MMNEFDPSDIRKLKQHIKSCPNIPADSFASRMVLRRLDQNLHRIDSSQKAQRNRKYVKKQKKTLLDSVLTCIRIFIIDIPLTLLFILVTTSFLVDKYYIHYITPMIEAANWIDNDRLEHEFTYYERPCDTSDITATSIADVVLNQNEHDVDYAVDNFMVHGMGLFQNILDEDVSNELRTYIRKRNFELTDDEIIPLDTPGGRHSFGIDANEHPSVALALNQIGSHTLLHETLEKLLGPDPAVAEITAITVEPGARAQGWHPDVKPEGNSLKYGQTFTHSYSLFIPLQNVTKRMGATELCPGTHFCASNDLEQMCRIGGFQASESNSQDGAWKTGDGLMMNQKMWHRGGAYYTSRTEANPDRVVFILTFVSRPNFGKDHRQLSHGTYFHIHPFMYGHTFADLKTAQVSMSFPFSMLRSIGIWKPPNANWGYDWVTSASLRLSNDENGYKFEDLEAFYHNHEIAKILPSFLHGEVDEESGWKTYIGETIHNFRTFFTIIYTICLVLYLMSVLVVDVVENGKQKRFVSSISRLALINITILLLAHQAIKIVKNTQLCQSVDNKTIYSRPFLPKRISHSKKKSMSTNGMKEEPVRLTTTPVKTDVLLGNRYDSKFIGNYINFLNYHPGNRDLKQSIESYSDLYLSYITLTPMFQNELIVRVEDSSGRFLLQNDFGEWTEMTSEERRHEILKMFAFSTSEIQLFPVLDKEIAILLSSAKFGTVLRNSIVMKKLTQQFLYYWRKDVLGAALGVSHLRHNSTETRTFSSSKFNHSSLFKLNPYDSKKLVMSPSHKRKKFFVGTFHKKHSYKVGDKVLYNYQGSGFFVDGTIVHMEFGNYGIVERRFEDGVIDRTSVYFGNVKPFIPLTEEDRVALIERECPRCLNEYIPGVIKNVYPSLEYDVLYEATHDLEQRISGDFLARDLLNDQ